MNQQDFLAAETEDELRRLVVAAGIPWWPFTRTAEYAAWVAAHPAVTRVGDDVPEQPATL